MSRQTGAPVPPPGVPGPFSLDDPGQLAALLSGAELADVAVSELSTPLLARSFDEWWTRTCDLAGPLARMLASLPEQATQALRAHVLDSISEYRTPTGLEFPGSTLLGTARRA